MAPPWKSRTQALDRISAIHSVRELIPRILHPWSVRGAKRFATRAKHCTRPPYSKSPPSPPVGLRGSKRFATPGKPFPPPAFLKISPIRACENPHTKRHFHRRKLARF